MDNVKIIEKKALDLALECGKILMDQWDKVEICHYKKNFDFCTNLDIQIEKHILNRLKKYYPTWNYLAEESGWHDQKSEYTWIIDPLDGTKNYERRLPIFNTTMALKRKNEIIFGVVYSPATHEIFHAIKGQGAFRAKTSSSHSYKKNTKKPLKISQQKNLKKTIIHFDIPRMYKTKQFHPEVMIRALALKTHLLRSIGSGALGLAYTAQGSFDAFFDLHGMGGLWDVAAGFLLIQEAGGIITDFDGNIWKPGIKGTIAANPKIHGQILKIIREYRIHQK
ncbi:inositol monophosphatase [Candidatus Peregrinibacteria bacterium]|nr:inositol monophosphatase [Candidatus Peregrinibacteria bacterium]